MKKPDCVSCDYSRVCKQKGEPWKYNKPCPTFEKYANQDEVEPLREIQLSQLHCEPSTNGKKVIQGGNLFLILKMRYIEFKKPVEIANELMVSKRYVNKVIQKETEIFIKYLKKRFPSIPI